MAVFQICDSTSGKDLGAFEAADESDALEALAKSKGFETADELAASEGRARRELARYLSIVEVSFADLADTMGTSIESGLDEIVAEVLP